MSLKDANAAWAAGRSALAGELRAVCVRLYPFMPEVAPLALLDSLLDAAGEQPASAGHPDGRIASLLDGWEQVGRKEPYAHLFFSEAAAELRKAMTGPPPSNRAEAVR